MTFVRFQGKPFNTTVIQVYTPTSNGEEAEAEFYEDLQDLLELIPQKDVLFIIGDWNEKVAIISCEPLSEQMVFRTHCPFMW